MKSNKYVKSIVLVLLTIVMALSPQVSPVPIGSTINTVNAATKKPALNVKSKTLKVGETYQLKIKNFTSGKCGWSSHNKRVASVNKNGLVTAKKKGTAIITVTYLKYYFSCKIKVVSGFDSKEAESKITFTPVSTCDDLYEVTSTYSFPTRVTINYRIMDNSGVTIEKSSTEVYATTWGASYVSIPSSNENQTVKTTYKYTECLSSFTEDRYKNIINNITIEKIEKDEDVDSYYNLYIYLKNNAEKEIGNFNIGLLLYDEQGRLFKCLNSLTSASGIIYIDSIDAGETIKKQVYVYQEDIAKVSDIKYFVYH